MALVEFEQVDLLYPVRFGRGSTLKEYVCQKILRRRENKPDFVKALSSVTFHIAEGERVAFIGLNGAGKSTLLRAIGGIYPINRGQRRVEGSVWSLFDIALGFEPEATGWENIFYRSYLQGELPQEVRAKIKEIGEFSELGDFLDLPLRCYSKGMVMRLAFAIATSSYPEILLVDEVFATGDLVFRRKAEARMRDFLHRAKIVILVGNQMEFLEEFCTRAIWLNQGEIQADGPAAEVIGRYVRQARDEKEPPEGSFAATGPDRKEMATRPSLLVHRKICSLQGGPCAG